MKASMIHFTFFVTLVFSSCGQQSSEGGPVAAPVQTNIAGSTNSMESRRQVSYFIDLCQRDGGREKCKVHGMRSNGNGSYTVKMGEYKTASDGSVYVASEPEYVVTRDGQDLFDLQLYFHPDGCTKKVHSELKNGYLKLIHPGCNDGEIVIATWEI